MEAIWIGSSASILAGLATGIGALPILFTKNISDKTLDTMLGFSAGIMLAATFFSLLTPAINLSNIWTATLGLTLGAITMHIADTLTPHLHTILGAESWEGPPSKLPRIWLFTLAITIHNFPEGLAVGVSFGSGNITEGTIIAIAIALQNMPEGLAVALPLLREGYSKPKALSYSTITGLIEPIGGILGATLTLTIQHTLPWTLAYAAGAMLFVISDEIIPESHRKGFEKHATFGLIIGFIVMMILDNTLK